MTIFRKRVINLSYNKDSKELPCYQILLTTFKNYKMFSNLMSLRNKDSMENIITIFSSFRSYDTLC